MVAFTSTRGGSKNIWVKQTVSGESIQVTKDDFGNRNPVWSQKNSFEFGSKINRIAKKCTFNGENNGDGWHFVIIIGWDDKKDGGAWLVKNSFGKDWGENGFGWIKYGSNNIGQFAARIDARNY